MQFHTVVDNFANVKASPEATLFMLRALSLFAITFDGIHLFLSSFYPSLSSLIHLSDVSGALDVTKVGALALESMRAHPSHLQVQAQGCHVIGAWADRLRRALHAPDAAASLLALLPYTSVIVSALIKYSDQISVVAEGFSAIAFLLVLGTSHFLLLFLLQYSS
jgi:hypothetical protein